METSALSRSRWRERVAADIAIWRAIERKERSFPFTLRLFLLTPGFQFVFARRLQEAARRVPLIGKGLRMVLWWLSCLVFGAEIALAAEIDGGLYVPHPFGIVIGRCRLGANAVVMQNVTIGNRGVRDAGAPMIGDCCSFGAGAVVLGDVRIGDHAVVGANSVVLADVAGGHVVVGSPARSVRSGHRETYDFK